MADVTVCKRKCYSGLDADKPATANLGDTYAASDSKLEYFWTGTEWKELKQIQYVPRLVAVPDKQVGDFVTDGTWKVDGLDLSGVVPAGAIAVHFMVMVQDDAVGSYFAIRRDAVNTLNYMQPTTQVANVNLVLQGIIACDTNRLFDYTGSNLAFTTIDVTVLGWFI